MRRCAQFSDIPKSKTSPSVNRHFRLIALATMELLCTTPISTYGININITDNPLEPWKGFAEAHFNYSRVGQYPFVTWRLNSLTIISTELTRCSLVFCAFSFFAFFGLGNDARKNYRKAFWAIAKFLGFPPPWSVGAIKHVRSRRFGGQVFLAHTRRIRPPPRAIPIKNPVGSLPAYSATTSNSSTKFFLPYQPWISNQRSTRTWSTTVMIF
jgi:pheromone a factor receptor